MVLLMDAVMLHEKPHISTCNHPQHFPVALHKETTETVESIAPVCYKQNRSPGRSFAKQLMSSDIQETGAYSRLWSAVPSVG